MGLWEDIRKSLDQGMGVSGAIRNPTYYNDPWLQRQLAEQEASSAAKATKPAVSNWGMTRSKYVAPPRMTESEFVKGGRFGSGGFKGPVALASLVATLGSVLSPGGQKALEQMGAESYGEYDKPNKRSLFGRLGVGETPMAPSTKKPSLAPVPETPVEPAATPEKAPPTPVLSETKPGPGFTGTPVWGSGMAVQNAKRAAEDKEEMQGYLNYMKDDGINVRVETPKAAAPAPVDNSPEYTLTEQDKVDLEYPKKNWLYSGFEGRASGGPIEEDKPYLVGENGPEVVVPAQSGIVVPNQSLGMGEPIPREELPRREIPETKRSTYDDALDRILSEAETASIMGGKKNMKKLDVLSRVAQVIAPLTTRGHYGVSREGLESTMRGQDVISGTTQRGQDTALRGHELSAQAMARGQDIAAQTSAEIQKTTKRGQDIIARGVKEGHDIETMKGAVDAGYKAGLLKQGQEHLALEKMKEDVGTPANYLKYFNLFSQVQKVDSLGTKYTELDYNQGKRFMDALGIKAPAGWSPPGQTPVAAAPKKGDVMATPSGRKAIFDGKAWVWEK